MPEQPYASALARVHDRIRAACDDAGRPEDAVRLLLATKTQTADAVRAAVLADAEAGWTGTRATLVGENRVQELAAKAGPLSDLGLRAHLIGPLQSNKVNHALRALAEHGGACVETVDGLPIAARLAERVRAAGVLAPLDVLVQVNVSGEETKSGVAPEGAAVLAEQVAALDGLRLRGFMTIGAQSADEARVRAGFAVLRGLRDAVVASGAPGTAEAVELSMGMSRDLDWAVAEGATIVRVGSAVFGAR